MLRASSAQVRVLTSGSEHCAALIGGLLLLVVRNDPTLAIHAEQVRWMQRMQEASPEGSAFLTILRSDTPPPTEAARKIIKQVLFDFGRVAKAGCIVIEGKGFVAATFRSVLSVILLALRPEYPFKLFAEVEEGARWVMEYVGRSGQVSPLDVVQTAEEIKRRYADGTLTVTE